MVVNVCGFGWSGSGAYIDLLHEYGNVVFPSDNDWEFNFLWAPDSLYDLEFKLCTKHCRIYDSDLAIKRFLEIAQKYGDKRGYFKYDKIFQTSFYDLCKNYVDQLVQFQLKGDTFVHKLNSTLSDKLLVKYNTIWGYLLLNRLCRSKTSEKIYYKLRYDNYKVMRISYNPSNFVEITKQFVDSLFTFLRKNQKGILVLNQSLPPDVPFLFEHYFSEPQKTIIIRRDPRDNFIIINELKGKTRPVPTNVDDFIVFYKKIIGETKFPDTNNIMSLNFEDLVYNYEKTIERIESFIGLGDHLYKKKYFNPMISKNNTQLFKLLPKYSDDINKIEKELKPYLYNFEDYDYKRSSNCFF